MAQYKNRAYRHKTTVRPMTLLDSYRLGLEDLRAPEARSVLSRAFAFSLAAFVALAIAVQVGIGYVSADQAGWLRTLLDLLGGLATLVAVWFLFPAVATFFAGAMLDRMVSGIEARHYPAEATDGAPTWRESIATSARFAAVAIALNLVLLPVYLALLFVPPFGPLAFLGVNGYLLGREYFELVALRHLDPATMHAVRKANGGRIFLAGVLLTFLFAIPIVNLFAPVLGAAAMVHLFHGLRP